MQNEEKITDKNRYKEKEIMTLSRWTRFAATLLVVVLLGDSIALASKKPIDPAVMKAKIQARGVGQGVRVTFADKTELTGTIVAVNDQTFALKPKKAAQPSQVEYAKVTGVYEDKLTRGQKVALVAIAVAVVVVIVGVYVTVQFDHNFGRGLDRSGVHSSKR
jgi:cell division protein FtsL